MLTHGQQAAALEPANVVRVGFPFSAAPGQGHVAPSMIASVVSAAGWAPGHTSFMYKKLEGLFGRTTPLRFLSAKCPHCIYLRLGRSRVRQASDCAEHTCIDPGRVHNWIDYQVS